jgi:hypothetical protein
MNPMRYCHHMAHYFKQYKRATWLCCLLCCSSLSMAVQLSTQGSGQVLIYPYYSVNNDLNTAYTVVNTTDQPKAIKITFREGEVGIVVLTFNVYLDAFDVWTGALVPTTSTLPGHQGEPSGMHLSTDTSCVPYLPKAGQQLLPYLIDEDLYSLNTSMARARHGFFEVVEMGVLTGEAADHVAHTLPGVPESCRAISNDWEDGSWDFEELAEPTGGLEGSAILVDVAQGLSFSYDALALEQFWAGAGMHTDPGSVEPNLDSGSTQSRRLLDDGRLLISDWAHGYQAVSAVLMHHEVINEYLLAPSVAGKTEWVLSFPTKHHHVRVEPGESTAPFTERWDGRGSCDAVYMGVTNASGYVIREPPCEGNCDRVHDTYPMCTAIGVISFFNPNNGSDNPEILGAVDPLSLAPFRTNSFDPFSGWVSVYLNQRPMVLTANSGERYSGLPVTGFAVVRYSNAGAAEGLLAQYGGLFMHKGRVSIED